MNRGDVTVVIQTRQRRRWEACVPHPAPRPGTGKQLNVDPLKSARAVPGTRRSASSDDRGGGHVGSAPTARCWILSMEAELVSDRVVRGGRVSDASGGGIGVSSSVDHLGRNQPAVTYLGTRTPS